MSSRRLLERAIVACCSLLVGPSAALADDPPLLTAWKRHGEEVKTLEVHWTCKRHLEPGSEAGKNLRTQATDGTLYPPRPLELETKHGLWLSGDRWRLEWKGEEWSYEVERPITQHRIKVFDGQKSLVYFGQEHADVDAVHDVGSVLPAMANDTLASTPDVAVIFSIYRPFAEPYGHFAPSQWVMVPQSSNQEIRIAGVPCKLFRFQQSASTASHKSVAIATADPMLIHRLDFFDRLIFEVNYDQSQSPALRSWTMTKLSPTGSIQAQEAITVTSLAENIPVDESMFTLEFPEGTQVTDETPGKGKDHVYIVRGGQERVVSMLERRSGVPYSVLRSTATDEFRTVSPSRDHGWKWYVLGGSGLIAIVALAFWLRRLRSIRN